MPAASYIVSNISAINSSIAGVIFSMRWPFCRNAGWPYLTIGKNILLRLTAQTIYTETRAWSGLVIGPGPKRLREVINVGTARAANIKPAGGHAEQDTGRVVKSKQLA